MRKTIDRVREKVKGIMPVWLAWTIWNIVMLVITSLCSQTILDHDFLYIGFYKILLGMIIIELVVMIFFIITGRIYISTVLGTFLLLVLSVASYYVYHFRGTELMPLDILSVQTAANVASNYTFEITEGMVMAAVIWLVFVILGFLLPKQEKQKGLKGHLLHRAKFLGLTVVLFFSWFFLSRSVKMETWGNNGSKFNGFFLNFSLQLKSELTVKKPKGYSLDVIRQLEIEYAGADPSLGETGADMAMEMLLIESGGSVDPGLPDSETADDTIPGGDTETGENTDPAGTDTETAQDADGERKRPDIIVILEESFVDLSVVGDDVDGDVEILPYWNALGENAVKGYALSSVYGGGTANSEWEVLTGNTMGFLSSGATPYQLYIYDPVCGMASYLRSMGYTCESTHPFYSTGWSRRKVYPYMAFHSSSWLARYPQVEMVRKYVSDREMFRHVINMWRQKKEGESMFIFGITMQNHGGYYYSGEGRTPTVKLEGYEGTYPDVEQYLGCAHESDSAIQFLLDYYSRVDDPVVICIFGDHFPNINSKFLEELHGGEFVTLDEQQLKQTVPYIVWANYDIKEEDPDLTCLSMMSSIVYDVAGIEQPPYNRFLQDMKEVIPTWNALGYYSKSQGGFIEYDDAEGIEAEWIFKYRCLQYNNLFDIEHRSTRLFPTIDVGDEPQVPVHSVY
ncbi:MAG: sulfatase-like hydrolase/transferase [Lachnospiraceae bacterium]|nr:sulfatase-like hydrolase/transferase [Lachnospiraceae bacterium]